VAETCELPNSQNETANFDLHFDINEVAETGPEIGDLPAMEDTQHVRHNTMSPIEKANFDLGVLFHSTQRLFETFRFTNKLCLKTAEIKQAGSCW